jgi:hypothetical protein
MSNVSNARKFFSMSKRQLASVRVQIPDLIALIEAQEHLRVQDVIDTLKGFQNYTENKPSEALKQKLSRWVETYGKNHIDIARDAFQILKYSEGVIDAGTLRPLLEVCIERREKLLAEDQIELDAICKTWSVSPPLRQKSEKSEKSEVDTSYSRAAAGREPRENFNVGATPPVSNKAMGLFNNGKIMPDELLEYNFIDVVTNEQLKERAQLIGRVLTNQLTDGERALMTPEQRKVVNTLSLMGESKHGKRQNMTPEQSQDKSATDDGPVQKKSATDDGLVQNKSATDDGPVKAGTTWNLSFLNLTLNGCSSSTLGYIALLCAAATFLHQNPLTQFQGLYQKDALALGSVPASKSNAGATTPESTTSSSTTEEPTNSSQDDDRPFIVLTETKLSKRHIPVWARYSPLPIKDQKKEEDDQKKDKNGTKEDDYLWDGSWDFINNMKDFQIMKVLEMIKMYTSVSTLTDMVPHTIRNGVGPLMVEGVGMLWKVMNMIPAPITVSRPRANAGSNVYENTRARTRF